MGPFCSLNLAWSNDSQWSTECTGKDNVTVTSLGLKRPWTLLLSLAPLPSSWHSENMPLWSAGDWDKGAEQSSHCGRSQGPRFGREPRSPKPAGLPQHSADVRVSPAEPSSDQQTQRCEQTKCLLYYTTEIREWFMNQESLMDITEITVQFPSLSHEAFLSTSANKSFSFPCALLNTY